MLFQDYDCFPWMSVWDNIQFSSRGTRTGESRQIELLTHFGLLQWRDAWPWLLSGGMRKRLGLARCIVADPDLLLLDEPFGSLDYGTKLEVSNVLVKYLKENNKKAILVSRSVDDLMMLADRALVSRRIPLELEFRCERGNSSVRMTHVLARLEDEQFRHALISLTMDHPNNSRSRKNGDGSTSDMTFSRHRMTVCRHRLALQAGAGGSYLIMTQGGISMRFRRLVAILHHGGADLIALVFGLRQGRVGQQKRQPHGGHHYPFDHPASAFIANDKSLLYQ